MEVVTQEMARLNIDILGISELKWMGMGKFNSDDHYIYLKKEMATHSSILAWRIPWTGEPCREPSMGSHRVRYN